MITRKGLSESIHRAERCERHLADLSHFGFVPPRQFAELATQFPIRHLEPSDLAVGVNLRFGRLGRAGLLRFLLMGKLASQRNVFGLQVGDPRLQVGDRRLQLGDLLGRLDPRLGLRQLCTMAVSAAGVVLGVAPLNSLARYLCCRSAPLMAFLPIGGRPSCVVTDDITPFLQFRQ